MGPCTGSLIVPSAALSLLLSSGRTFYYNGNGSDLQGPIGKPLAIWQAAHVTRELGFSF